MTTRVLIIHHTLWSHYKNGLYKYLLQHKPADLDIKVVQISAIEGTRESMELKNAPDYPYTLLFDLVLEQVPKFRALIKLIQQVNEHRPHVVNVNGFFALYHFGIMAYCRLKGIKVVLNNDSTLGDNPTAWWKNIFKQIAMALAHRYFCFGDRSADYVKKFGGKEAEISSKRMAVVDNAFFEAEYTRHLPNKELLKDQLGIKTKKNIVYVGRFIAFKQLDVLVKQFMSLQSEWGLILIGDGPTKADVQDISDESIYFLGGRTWQEIPELLTLADVFVLPSISEPWGLVVNEAMVCRIPVLVSDKCGSAQDLAIDGETAIVFDGSSPESLRNKLEVAMSQTHNLTEKAYNRVQNFSFENASQDMIKCFQDVASY